MSLRAEMENQCFFQVLDLTSFVEHGDMTRRRDVGTTAGPGYD